MKAIITVLGKDTIGIVHKVSEVCVSLNANILEVKQSILDDIFAMIMYIDISKINCEFTLMVDELKKLGEQNGLYIHVMHEDILKYVNKI